MFPAGPRRGIEVCTQSSRLMSWRPWASRAMWGACGSLLTSSESMMLVLSAVAPGLRAIRFRDEPLAASDARMPIANESSTLSTKTTTATTTKVSVVLSLRTKRLSPVVREW